MHNAINFYQAFGSSRHTEHNVDNYVYLRFLFVVRICKCHMQKYKQKQTDTKKII